MTWPTSKWLSIVFALLLVNRTCGLNTSAERGYIQPADGGGSDKYDVIDVAKQKSNNDLNKMLTGQTTRIILTGEVDDDFWLKHLGEDYKHAVHLMVGGRNDPQNPYPGEHNMNSELYGVKGRSETHAMQTKAKPEYYDTKTNIQLESKTEQHATKTDNQHDATKTNDQANETKTDLKEPYEMSEQVDETPKESPVENLENAENVEIAEPVTYIPENITVTENPISGNTTETHAIQSTKIETNTDDDNSKNTPIQESKNETEHMAPENSYPEDKTYAEIFAIGDKLANTFYNPNSFQIPDGKPHKNILYTDTLHKYSTPHKYTHSVTHTDYKHTQPEQHPMDDREYSGDGDHLDEGKFLTDSQQKPFVINLPDPPKSMVQQLSDAVTPVVVKMPPVIYHQKPKQYYRSTKEKSSQQNTTPQNTLQNTQQSTQQQTLSYPLSQRYANYYNQPQTQQQQQQQQQLYPQYQDNYYNPILANSYDQSSYTGQNLYQPSAQLASDRTADSIPGLRYILGKSVGPYAEIHKQIQNNADSSLYDGYTRVSRSYRKYFNDGL